MSYTGSNVKSMTFLMDLGHCVFLSNTDNNITKIDIRIMWQCDCKLVFILMYASWGETCKTKKELKQQFVYY